MPRTLPLPKGNERIWRDLLPPEPLRTHGRHVYVFRNTQTNQIVYTLYPRIEQRTLRQLPFIGKHSVPPRIRPDLWTAHCRVGPFPTGSQGRDAFKKLREFRKLHELCWNKNNPGWSKEPKKRLIKLVMDQRENTAADLARVLSIQETLGSEMAEKREERQRQQTEYLDKRWKRIEDMAKMVEEGKIEELKKILDRKAERASKLDNDSEVRRLEDDMRQMRRKIREFLWTRRIVKQRDEAQERLQKTFESETKKVNMLKAKLNAEGKTEEAERLHLPRMGRNEVRDSLIPRALKPFPRPFSLRGVECQWADLYDPEYAGDAWPAAVVHSPMQTTRVLTMDEYNEEIEGEKKAVEAETRNILEDLVIRAENERREAEGLPPLSKPEVQPQAPERTGFSKYAPTWLFKNPFKRASL